MGLFKDAAAKLHNEGPVEFIKALQRWSNEKLAFLSGSITFTIDERRAMFVTENRQSVKQTQSRLESEYNQMYDLLEELNDDDVFFDVGANVGLYSCFASNECSKVVAFEPYPPNVNELEQNKRLNGENISIQNIALSNESGVVGLSVPDSPTPGYGGSSIGKDAEIQVRSSRGDELIENGTIPCPNVVKIDVEGAEPLVIEGLEATLSDKGCRTVYCEVHKSMIGEHGWEYADILSHFENLGFEVNEIDERAGQAFIKAHSEDS